MKNTQKLFLGLLFIVGWNTYAYYSFNEYSKDNPELIDELTKAEQRYESTEAFTILIAAHESFLECNGSNLRIHPKCKALKRILDEATKNAESTPEHQEVLNALDNIHYDSELQ